MRGRTRAIAAAALLLLAGLGVPAAQAESHHRPTVVVAVADSGVNPYHSVFYRPENTEHPCTWELGFTDCSIPALRLTIGADLDYDEVLEVDRAVWESARPGQWYWIPRTNIIGAVCDEAGPTETSPGTCILDEDSHGTGTASSILSEAPDALLLVHEGDAGADHIPTAPVVPDVQSHSWGAPVPLPDQATSGVMGGCLTEMQHHPESLFFKAAGNEAPLPAIADCRMQRPDVQIVGGGFPGYWTTSSWSTYDFASWFCRPVASHDDTLDATYTNCGTSFAAPTAAGAAAEALLRIRQRDGWTGRSTATHVSRSMTRDRFLDALRTAATYAPEAKYPSRCLDPDPACAEGATYFTPWLPLPEQAPWVFWGYGWLDSTVVDEVVSCATGGGCPDKPAEATEWNAQRQSLREQLGLAALSPAERDGDREGDAGDSPETAVRVRPGVPYTGRLAGGVDWRDAFSFRARAGQRLTMSATAAPAAPLSQTACWTLLDPAGNRLTETSTGNVTECQPGTTLTDLALPSSGAYTVVYTSHVPHSYEFSVELSR